jgi:hypothetical protein
MIDLSRSISPSTNFEYWDFGVVSRHLKILEKYSRANFQHIDIELTELKLGLGPFNKMMLIRDESTFKEILGSEPPARKVIYQMKNSYLTQYSNYQKQFIHP